MHRLDASVICTAQIQQKVFFFGEQLFDFFCERRNLPGQVVLLDEVQLGGILLFCTKALRALVFCLVCCITSLYRFSFG